MRVDFHPDQFCVLNSTNKDVFYNTINILKYHYRLLDMMNIKNKVLVLHVGSGVLGKDNSINRFVNKFNKLPKYLQECIAIENDDKVFNVSDMLKLSSMINVPVVLDYHHFMCNHTDSNIEKYLDTIFSSWKNINPKIHFSSPKNKTKKEMRSHHDYIDASSFLEFLNIIKNYLFLHLLLSIHHFHILHLTPEFLLLFFLNIDSMTNLLAYHI